FFGMDESIGLTSVLIGDLSLSEALVAAPAPNLTVLPAGPVPPYPAELLQSQEMADVIEGLKRSFDVVIIDTPPLLPITDAAILAPLADLTLLVVVARPSLVRRGDANGSSRGDGTCSRCHHNPGWSHTRGGDRRAVGTTARPG
ncbi:MAG TPA: CpsD/CapB family tyrosine-protein kinase, partial [Acidimicrobiales bacterium]|nr:CpsD/CapB family tyrosine-protein kinase [Acidimicrobiales bacterium]